jgi:urease accessory protein
MTMMPAVASLLAQRSTGRIDLALGAHGVERLRQEGAAKLRLPPGSTQAILINTGGGLVGGDCFSHTVSVSGGAHLTVTGQAAERCYRSLGPPAVVESRLQVGEGSSLFWLPQETIVFDRAGLQRTITAQIAPGARFLGLESLVLGRAAMGEVITSADLVERWRIHCGGRLIFADDLRISGAVPGRAAALADARALATIVYVAGDAEARVVAVREAVAGAGGASAWDGKLIARVLGRDGFLLRKALSAVLSALVGGTALPKIWSH